MREIPRELLKGYTMDSKVSIMDLYIAPSGARQHFNYTSMMVEFFMQKVRDKGELHYLETDGWLYQALEKYSVKDHDVLIIGSEEPCYEAAAFVYGAKEVTMVEYQKVTSQYPNLKTMTVDEFGQDTLMYDSTITISSLEHSGLGRYGDPLDPDGDLKAMKVLLDRTKVGGLCFLAVPMGKDQILWNAHRIYGRLRFPLLTEGWEIVESFGFIESDFDVDEALKRQNGKHPHRPGVSGGAHQPVFVLRKK